MNVKNPYILYSPNIEKVLLMSVSNVYNCSLSLVNKILILFKK